MQIRFDDSIDFKWLTLEDSCLTGNNSLLDILWSIEQGRKLKYHVAKKKIGSRQENTSIIAQENESRYSDIFVLILVAFFQKRPKAAFSKIETAGWPLQAV